MSYKNEILKNSGLNEEIFYQQLNEGIQFFKDSNKFSRVLQQIRSVSQGIQNPELKSYVMKVYSSLNRSRRSMSKLEKDYERATNKAEQEMIIRKHLAVVQDAKNTKETYKEDLNKILTRVGKDSGGKRITSDAAFVSSVVGAVAAFALFAAFVSLTLSVYGGGSIASGVSEIGSELLQRFETFFIGGQQQPFSPPRGVRIENIGLSGAFSVVMSILTKISARNFNKRRAEMALSSLSSSLPELNTITDKARGLIAQAKAEIPESYSSRRKRSMNESIIPVIFHPFKTPRIKKAIMRILDDLWNEGLFEEYTVNNMLGFFKIFPDKNNRDFFYKVSITGFGRSDEAEASSARKFTREKLEFIGKIKSPFKFFKIKDRSIYYVFETLIETMSDDLKNRRLAMYVDEERMEKMRVSIERARVKVQAIKNVDLGRVNVGYSY